MSVENFKKQELSVGIVGAGPAGAMLAYLLKLQGHKVQILERRIETERKVCGEYLCPKGVELLEQLNLVNTVCEQFLPLHGMVLVSPKNEVIPSYFPRPKGTERVLSVNRQIFDQNLLRLAIESGAELLSNKTVTKVSRLPEGRWKVETNDEFFEYDFLVAADGRQSKIGHSLGHIREINTKRAAIHCYLPRKTERGVRLGEMHIFANKSYCGLDPINDDEVNFSIVCDSQRLKNEKPLQLINESIKHSSRLSAMFDLIDETNPPHIRTVTCLKNQNNFIAGNNLAYVGDAAGFIDPLTGEGIYNAILSSKLLADSVANSPSLDFALASYKREKRKLSFQKNVLNNFFQFLIKRPFLVHLTAVFLKKSQSRANYFIGIIGNIYHPLEGVWKMLTN